MATGKSSPKHLLKVTLGFGRARSPYWHRKSQRKQSRCWLGNHHENTFQRWRVDLEALAAPVDSEKVNETTSKGDMWIRKSSQPLWLRNSQRKLSRCRLRNHHRNSFQRWWVDSEALAAPVDEEMVNENGVTTNSEIITETPFKGDTWIQESSQPLLT